MLQGLNLRDTLCNLSCPGVARQVGGKICTVKYSLSFTSQNFHYIQFEIPLSENFSWRVCALASELSAFQSYVIDTIYAGYLSISNGA